MTVPFGARAVNASALQVTIGKVAAMTCAVGIMIHPHGAVYP